MFRLDGMSGKYPAASLTGGECSFSCEHCKQVILAPMLATTSPEELLATAHRLKKNGNHGMLVSGGCDAGGKLPWERFAPVLRSIKEETGLILSVHAGFPDARQVRLLTEACVDQVLVDVIGDDRTLEQVYHAPFGVDHVRSSLLELHRAGLTVVPHVVCGLHYGKMLGEMRALEIIAEINPDLLVIVSLMPLPGTPMRNVRPPEAVDVVNFFVEAAKLMPRTQRSLGCARQRGSGNLERLVLDAGVDRMALPSPGTVEHALALGYDVQFQKTCCSVPSVLAASSWAEAM
jgi:uncharacterized radical SAM superfamily protein